MPPAAVTVTWTVPVPAGAVTVISVAEITFRPVAALEPKCTEVAPVNPGVIGRDLDLLSFDAILKAFHNLNVDAPRWNSQLGGAGSVKVMCFERTLRADEVIISMHPRVIGCVCVTILGSDKDPRRRRLPRRAEYSYRKTTHWP